MTMQGFPNLLRIKDSIDAVPVAQSRFFIVDEHCPAGERKQVFSVAGRGRVDLIVEIQTSKNDDQMMFEPQFDGQSELWCPQFVHDWLQLEAIAGQQSPIYTHVWNEVGNEFGIVFALPRYFSDSFELWLDNRDVGSEHVVKYLLILYSKYPAVLP
ncbi:MAG: hypothetical protein SVY53_05955 [Chloroflexota bacterium]|nr:hypothetical protein [Chloroflexota bacterium]